MFAVLFVAYVIADIFADIVPPAVQELGSELGNAWPFFLAIVIVGGVVYRFVKSAFAKGMHEIVVAEIRPMQEKVDEIQSQFKNNGGSTMKDAMDNITDRVEKITDRVEDIVVAQNILSDAQEIANEALIKHTDSDAENFQKILDLVGSSDAEMVSKATVAADAVVAEAALVASAVKAEATKVAEAVKTADAVVAEAIKRAEELRLKAINIIE